jgi:adenylate kinase
MRLALTGTPGTGKTHLAAHLLAHVEVRSVEDLAAAHGALGAREADGAQPVDVEGLRAFVEAWPTDLLVDGHLSHLLGLDAVVVLRCHPEVVAERLRQRGYAPAKVQANVEWERLGGVVAELLDAAEQHPLLELDTSSQSVEGLAETVMAWWLEGCPDRGPASIDWLG